MHIHILGICGTFMGGIALLAKQSGFKVTGSDRHVYPPMSDELKQAGIDIIEGFDASQLDLNPDLIVVGNVMKRGMPVVERMLNEKFRYVSGPQWLEEHYLFDKTVLAVAGTHGKTTTASMLAWILECCGKNPGFLIGGIPENFGFSARNTPSDAFVIEADEYDCAFFDKRSKFVHYHPNVLIMNNLEYDHADIFDSLKDIQKQFHHLVRTVPSNGLIVMPEGLKSLDEVVDMGCWTKVAKVGGAKGLHARLNSADGSSFELFDADSFVCQVNFTCSGLHNVNNALAAIKASSFLGIPLKQAALSLETFKLPKRRLELKGKMGDILVYDDFAHHPTAIRTTLEGLRAKIGAKRKLIAVFELRSNSMKLGANRELLPQAFGCANEAFIFAPEDVRWQVETLNGQGPTPLKVFTDFNVLLKAVMAAVIPGTVILAMSNGNFNAIHQKILDLLKAKIIC